jgi:hypothetical protein
LIEERLPGTTFGSIPSGPEKLAVLEGRGVAIPPELRQIFAKLPADEGGMYAGEGIFLEFFLGTDPTVKSLTVYVRGGGDPIPALRRLCEPEGWQVREPGGTVVDLQADDAADGWTRFTQYRDKGAEELRNRGTNL